MAMARTDPVFNLRMPLEMKDALVEKAKKNGRSLNAEIVQILENALYEENEKIHANEAFKLRSQISQAQTDAFFKERSNQKIDEQLEKIDELTKRLDLLLKSGATIQHNKKNT
ncbi:Arc family DNA-binding protein [Serratia quinivorans]|uniref:Arc family DNA-binding protein n=1 Tax=Serratia quinivorans TaxID=137545 RepID=UPI003982BC0A